LTTTAHLAGSAAEASRSRLLATPLLLAVLAAGACSPASSDDFRRSDFTPNRAQWSLPLDSYMVAPGADSAYAVQLLIKECLERQGISSFRVDDPPLPYPLINSQLRRLFDVTIARKYGYSGPDVNSVHLSTQSLEAMTPADKEKSLACAAAANKNLETEDKQQNRMETLAGLAYERAQRRSEIQKDLAAWKACLRPLGFADLPDDPTQMPSEAQRMAWHFPIVKQDVPYARMRRASTAEIKGATLDAECRESTGLAEDLYNAEIDEQFRQMNSHAEAVTEAKAYTERVNENIRATIQRLSG